MGEPETDHELVQKVLHGRTEVFNLLVWRWQRPLYNFLLRLTGERERALDLCQETFLRAYLRLEQLREREKFSSWLFRIAMNLYRSDQRSRYAARSGGWGQQVDVESADGPTANPTSETQLVVRALLSKLSPEQREIVLLKVYQGFRFDEIAAILECPVSTVKSRLYKAFEQLRAGFETTKPRRES